ncbi:MAG: RluA family pseudouridine synthase [Bacteroidales bacterium]|nr:RluA family pseudouridine synthase [Bacteroidales bacterium]
MFHRFQTDITGIALPEKFTFPFNYKPHPLCRRAADEVWAYVKSRSDWSEEVTAGKMFGVLVVRTPQHELGFVAAFSGLLAGRNCHGWFVPPIFDFLRPDGYFKQEETQISEISKLIDATPEDERKKTLAEERKQRSMALQKWLFRQFRLRNAQGEEKDLIDVFAMTTHGSPPGGAGECAEPKLLQYAFLQGLKPLAMAAFWMGASPQGEIRCDGRYYPACKGRCEPILRFMMQGLDVEPDPMQVHKQCVWTLPILYEDAFIAVVDKPEGMLSVPGKTDAPSVQSIMRMRYPDADGPMIVHRLDMSTSGLMIVVKTRVAHKNLQQQFLEQRIRKRYVALLQGRISTKSGTIDLPLCPDIMNRPRQMVSRQYGKPALTDYEVMGYADANTTRVAFYPHTGRTHQLRVHAAHPQGLNAPIVGDALYGQEGGRLCLHAEEIWFEHPTTHEPLHFMVPSSF